MVDLKIRANCTAWGMARSASIDPSRGTRIRLNMISPLRMNSPFNPTKIKLSMSLKKPVKYLLNKLTIGW